MAKCIQFYSGTNSYGKPVDVALSEHGQWYSRSYAFNGYQVAPTKWTKTQPPSHPKGHTNVYSGEFEEYSQEEQQKRISWGFTELLLVEGYTKARLPNIA